MPWQNLLRGGNFKRSLLIGAIIIIAIFAWDSFSESGTETISFDTGDDTTTLTFEDETPLDDTYSLFDSLDFSYANSAETADSSEEILAPVLDIEDVQLETIIDSSAVISDEEKVLVAEYLEASSDIGFPIPREVSFGILQHREGKSEELLDVISRFNDKQKELRALEAPESLTSYHERTVSLMDGYIGILVRVSAQSDQHTIDLLLSSPDYNALRTEGKGLYEEIKLFTTEHSIELSPDVLPQ